MTRDLRVLMLGFCLGASLFAAQVSPGRYALILSDAPAIQHTGGLRTAEVHRYAQQVRSAQSTLRADLESRGVHVTGAVQNVLNAVFVRATQDQAAQLGSMAGVKAVVPVHRFHMMMDKAVNLVNAPGAWQALGGSTNAGAGVKIAIIDSGIDQTHPAFQDSSLRAPSGFPKCSGTDCSFTTNKVIVARSYVSILAAGTDSTNPALDSTPDDYTPRDHIGHGTALAMVSAGATVKAPLATITGVAPKAWLGNYKVFGSPGIHDGSSGDAIIQALEDAYNDGMDIAVLSLGGAALNGPLDEGATCGQPSGVPCDIETYMVEHYVRAGMAVVVAAGNQGDYGVNVAPTLNSISSPGTAPSALTVGATTNSHTFVSTLKVPAADAPASIQATQAVFGDGPSPVAPVSAPLIDATTLDGTGTGCSAFPSNSLNGAFAIVTRTPGGCSFAAKVVNAQNAGAVGVVIVQASGGGTPSQPGYLSGTSIPAVMIGDTAGAALRSYLGTHPLATGTLDPTESPVSSSSYNQVASFSSRGPSVSYLLKPEVMAVGTDVYMAAQSYDPLGPLYSADRYIAADGTSFATPMAAGALALIKQKNPALSGVHLKSALVNSAAQNTVTDESGTAHTVSAGNGLMSVSDAIQTVLTVDPAAVSFGSLSSATRLPITRQITLHYTGSGSAACTLAVTARKGTAPTLSPSSVSISSAADRVVTLTLSGAVPAAGLYEGTIAIQASGKTVRVPYMFVVGDGIPTNIIPLAASLNGQMGQTGYLAFKVVDTYGVGVPYVGVYYQTAYGGGGVVGGDSRTDSLGMASATTVLGYPGYQEFDAIIGGYNQAFQGWARYQPVISGIANSASQALGGGIAPGSYIQIAGAALSDVSDYPTTQFLPVALDTVSVSFDVPAAKLSLAGRIIRVSPRLVMVQVPWELKGQTSAQMKVTIDGTAGELVTVPVSNYSPAFYTTSDGLAQSLDGSYRAVSRLNPVRRGKVVRLFLNGLGPVDTPPGDGEPAPASPRAQTLAAPTVVIGGKTAAVQFSGLVPGYPGINQVDVVVPADAPTGLQTLQLSIGGVSAPTVSLPVK